MHEYSEILSKAKQLNPEIEPDTLTLKLQGISNATRKIKAEKKDDDTASSYILMNDQEKVKIEFDDEDESKPIENEADVENPVFASLDEQIDGDALDDIFHELDEPITDDAMVEFDQLNESSELEDQQSVIEMTQMVSPSVNFFKRPPASGAKPQASERGSQQPATKSRICGFDY